MLVWSANKRDDSSVAKKATAIVPTMLRMREELRKRLEREAKKSGRSLNAEMVGRLELSFTIDEEARSRDSAIIDMLVNNDNVSSALLRQIALEMTKVSGAFRNEADVKNFLKGINFSVFGKEMRERIKSGEIPDDQPEGDER
jgi:hypothetical protein